MPTNMLLISSRMTTQTLGITKRMANMKMQTTITRTSGLLYYRTSCAVISISVIWTMATKTSWLGGDRILWFTMMLMPTGPTAMKLVAMADCNNADEKEKMSISKFLVV